MVHTLSDLLSRRTRLALTDPAAGIGKLSRAVELLAAELGWDEGRSEAERDAHRAAVETERNIPLGRDIDPELIPEGSVGA
jgi:glycerol-3-phosphate dehydrogenase